MKDLKHGNDIIKKHTHNTWQVRVMVMVSSATLKDLKHGNDIIKKHTHNTWQVRVRVMVSSATLKDLKHGNDIIKNTHTIRGRLGLGLWCLAPL